MSLFSSSSLNDLWKSRYCSTVIIRTDMDCKVFENNQELGTAKVDSPLSIDLEVGKHTLSLVYTEDDAVYKNIVYKVEQEDCFYRLNVELTKALREKIKEYDKTKNYRLLYSLCGKAAQQGNSTAQYELGICYEEGKGIPKNIDKAIEWYTKAAEKGLALAQYQLGHCFRFGQGVKINRAKAREWYTKAAEQGNEMAQVELGDFYYEIASSYPTINTLAALDYIKAANYYEKAFEQGWVWSGFEKAEDSWYKVGCCFESGNGVEKNLIKAMKWYSMSAKSGNINAQQAIDRLKQSGVRPVKYLFFDTETTGIPRDYNAPTSDSRNWPRLVQLSWITTDEDCNILSKNDHIIYPKGFIIPADAARVHGITTSMAKKKGEPLEEVLDKFEKDYDAAYYIVGHNVDFDKKIIRAELARLVKKDFILLSTKVTLCTMEASTDYCKIPGYHGYKWPKLQELYKKLFGCEFEDAHNSMSDVTATLKCFKEMRRIGVINNKP